MISHTLDPLTAAPPVAATDRPVPAGPPAWLQLARRGRKLAGLVVEALLLADRVLLDGHIAETFDVDLPRPRSIGHPRFVALRRQLLAGLGVADAEEEL
jgi:hypothetical protein